MKPFPIFRPGTHTAADGTKHSFGEAEINDMVDSYDPELHEAPICVGHPAHNAPAFGWIKSLTAADGGITAEPRQVSQEFAEMVVAGRYKKRSASFYHPGSPQNPKPGSWYLRHVGFLGAQPPAVKGMPDVGFAEDEDFVEFADPQVVAGVVAMVFRRLRDWLIEDKGREVADDILPDYTVAELEAQSREPPFVPEPEQKQPNFNEDDGDETMPDKTNLQDEAKKIEEDRKKLKAEQAEFAEQQRRFRRKQTDGRVAALVAAGKITPAQAPGLCEFISRLDDTTFEFGEGDAKKSAKPTDFLVDLLTSMKPQVDLNERSSDDDSNPPPNGAAPAEIAAAAKEYAEQKRAAGIEVTPQQAVDHVINAS